MLVSYLSKKPLWFKLQLLACLALLLPIWSFHYLPLNDWPNHLASMELLRLYDAGPPGFIIPNPLPLPPNSLVFLIMRAAAPLIGVEMIGRILLSLTLVLLPWSLSYVLGALDQNLEPLGLAGAALGYHWFFVMGFLNFALSIPLFLLAAGYWLRTKDRKDAKAVFSRLALFSLVFLAHLIAGLVLGLMVLLMRVADAWRTSQKGKKIQNWIFPILLDGLAFLPSLLLMALTLPAIFSNDLPSGIVWGTVSERLSYLLLIPPMPSISWLALGVLLLYALIRMGGGIMASTPPIVRRRLAHLSMPMVWILLALLMLLLALLVPESTSTWQFASPRFVPFFAFFALVGVGLPTVRLNFTPSIFDELCIGFFALTLVLVIALFMQWAPLQPPLASIAHLSSFMAPHSAVWPVGEGFAMSLSTLTSPYFHAWGYWILDKPLYTPYFFAEKYSPINYAEPTAHARDQTNRWLNELVFESFTNTSAPRCAAWTHYYQKVNWSAIAGEYDYVALRTGVCDNGSVVPTSMFKQIYAEPPLYLYQSKTKKP